MSGLLLEMKKILIPSATTKSEPQNPAPATIHRLPEPPAPVHPTQHGTISVASDTILVQDPKDDGDYPVVWVPGNDHMEVLVDGESVTGKVVLSANLGTQVVFKNDEPSVSINVSVSDDLLEVNLKVIRENGYSYHLEDVSPSQKAVLRVKAVPILPPPISPEDLLSPLAEQAFQGTVDYGAINRLIASDETIEAVVIRGTKPIEGKPEVYKPVELKKEYDPLRRRKQVATVKAGTRIGYKEPAEPSMDGVDVFGQPIPAPSPAKRLATLGDGVRDINGNLVALRDGRVHFSRSKIDVLPTLIIDHSLTPKDGYIVFDGDVVIFGDVLDGSRIRATGAVRVQGGAYGSIISGEHGVFIGGNITDSTILGGQEAVICKKLQPLVEVCVADLERFKQDFRNVSNQVAVRYGDMGKLPLAIRTLQDLHYKRLLRTLAELVDDHGDELLQKLERKVGTVKEVIQRKWQGAYAASVTDVDIEELLWMLTEFNHYIESLGDPEPADVRLESSTSSVVRASGNIFVTGAGVYATILQSDKSVVVRGDVRGGFVVAELRIGVGTAGTEVGMETSFKVNSLRGKLSIGEVHANTVVQVGESRRRILFTEHNISMGGKSA